MSDVRMLTTLWRGKRMMNPQVVTRSETRHAEGEEEEVATMPKDQVPEALVEDALADAC
jgi:hypothetical protein